MSATDKRPDGNFVSFYWEVIMKEKFLVLFFLLMFCVVLLPSQINAGAAGSPLVAAANRTSPQIRVEIGNRGRHRGWDRGRRAYWYNYDRHDRRM